MIIITDETALFARRALWIAYWMATSDVEEADMLQAFEEISEATLKIRDEWKQ